MEPHGLIRVGIATFAVGLVWGIIVPFAQFGGKFPPFWVVGVSVLPALWGGVWTYLARRGTWWLVLLGQWLSLCLACWWFLGSTTDYWTSPALYGGLVFGTILLAMWMIPVALSTAIPSRR